MSMVIDVLLEFGHGSENVPGHQWRASAVVHGRRYSSSDATAWLAMADLIGSILRRDFDVGAGIGTRQSLVPVAGFSRKRRVMTRSAGRTAKPAPKSQLELNYNGKRPRPKR